MICENITKGNIPGVIFIHCLNLAKLNPVLRNRGHGSVGRASDR